MRALLMDFIQTAFPGCTPLEAANGAQAIAQCKVHAPQLVLMDVSLPDANGIELIETLKALNPDLKAIVVSYHSGQVYVDQAFAAGALAYVTKDRLFVDLIPAVSEALGVPAAGRTGA